MSLFRRAMGLGAQAPADQSAAAYPVAETESVRRIAARLPGLAPDRARFVAAFTYLLARAANSDLSIDDVEAAEMTRQVAELSGLDAADAGFAVELARSRAARFGATEDYLVSREFHGISTLEDRERLLHCCLLVAAADDSVVAEEAWVVNRMAEELDVPRSDLNRIRAEFVDRMAEVREIRKLAGS
jgi:uncharacterized tellurite resistance protein B-like protein